MNTTAKYQTAADLFDAWRDALFTGAASPLYAVGTGALATVEIGPGRVVLVGGLPGGGKTALAMQWVIDALRAVPTLRAVVANVEMSAAVLLDRQLARLSGVPLDVIAKRKLGAEHADRINRGLATLESVAERLAFVAPPFDLGNIAATADDFGGALLTLDYLQRIRPPGEHADKRGSVDALMDYLRQFADAGCAVLAVSAVARTKDKRGRSSYVGDGLSLASFRESSELEYGADTAYVLVPGRDDPEAVTLRCLKHRHGEPMDVNLCFERHIQSFRPTEPEPSTPADRGKLTASLRALWGSTPAAADDDGGDE
ncbi:MAG: DnaB-like helicase C-terminal domain-containing protein [Planctomycetota bacterium]